MSATKRLRVELGSRGYDILIGAGVLDEAGAAIAPFAPGKRAAIVSDENVMRLHGPRLLASLEKAGLSTTQIVMSPGEGAKSFAGLERVIDGLLEAELERKDLVIAFGGGVIGDLAGLAAGLLKRGLDFVQVPTTLLAQVDSSVGGKTAINAKAGKNLVGLFHQPRLVLADLSVLDTLPPRERLAGYAEIVKMGLIDDPDFFAWCEEHGSRLVRDKSDRANLAVAVAHAANAKARIVAADERETGARALLNLGHTFAHGIEAEAGMGGVLLHGEAVGCGIALAFGFSARLGLCSEAEHARVVRHLREAGFATRLGDLPGGPYHPERLLEAIRHDKKNEGGRLTFILARGVGKSFIAKDVDQRDVLAFLEEAAKAV